MKKINRKEITILPIIWTNYVSRDGKHPIKLKVTANRRTKNYCIQSDCQNLSLTPEQAIDVLSFSPKPRNRTIKEAIEKFKAKALEAAENITRGGKPFSHERFEKELFSAPVTTSFLDQFKRYLDNLLSDERIGTYDSYLSAYNVLVLYLKAKKFKEQDFSAYDITYEFLKDLEKFLLQTRNKTTLGIYARTIRTIYNYCASQDYQLKELYPFGKGPGKYKLQNTRVNGNKRGDALTNTELKKFISLNPKSNTPEYKAKMLWLFSFYCQGMNFKDICLLKYSNVKGQTLQYIREKTKRTEGELTEISLPEHIREIIVKLGNPDKNPDAYIFGLLPSYVTDPFTLEPLIHQATKTTNKWLRRLCAVNDLPPMTTYWSRHTYASLLKFSGVSVDLIRELLGHSDAKTTEHYLKRFDLVVKREINSRLYEQIMTKAS